MTQEQLTEQYRQLEDEIDRMEEIAQSASPRVVDLVLNCIELKRRHLRHIEERMDRNAEEVV